MSDPAADAPLDFSSPEGPATAPACASCKRPIADQYWSAGPAVLCQACKEALESGQVAAGGLVAGASRFSRALLFGLGGMLAGAAAWYGVAKLANIEAGIIAILLGFLVGKAVFVGSGHRGGRRYQVLAVILTYLGIGTAYAPFAVEGYLANEKAAADSAAAVHGADPAAPNRPVSELSPEELQQESKRLDSLVAAQDSHRAAQSRRNPVLAGVMLAGIALAGVLTLPVLALVGSFSVLSVLFYVLAIVQAWRTTRSARIEIAGPFRVGGAAPA
jgi:hypothetical protein